MGEGSNGASRFHYNLLRYQQRLEIILPHLVLNTWPEFSFTRTESGELNINELHSSAGALKEATAQFDALDLNEIHLICYFGIGLGYFYLAAKEWLAENRNRYLLFLEDQEGVIRHFLETELATEILDNPQVHICPLVGHHMGQIAAVAEYFAGLPAHILALPHYSRTRPNVAERLGNDLAMYLQARSFLAGPAIDAQKAAYHNFYTNAARMDQAIWGKELLGKFEGTPAIVCGAGPSLEKQLPLLRELQDRALIIAAGSAAPILSQAGIEPHLIGGLCPHPLEGHRFWHADCFEVPIVYRSRIDHTALSLIHGPHIYTNGCEGAERLAAWLEERLGIVSPFVEAGPSVFYFSCQWMRLMGCNPILFVGLDLALSSTGDVYSEGVLGGGETLLSPVYEEVERNDIYGRQTLTYQKWIYESMVLSYLVRSHPEVTYINCTEGGIGVESVENMPLLDAADQYLKCSWDVRGELHAQLEGAEHKQITRAAIDSALEELASSCRRTIELVDKIGAELAAVEKGVVRAAYLDVFEGKGPKASEPPPWIRNGLLALLQSDLEEELIYHLVFGPFLRDKRLFQKRLYDQFAFERGSATVLRWRQQLSILQEQNMALQREARHHLARIEGGMYNKTIE